MAQRIDVLLSQLHGAIGEARLLSVDDPRWGVYWAEAKRLADQIESMVPDSARPVTRDDQTV